MAKRKGPAKKPAFTWSANDPLANQGAESANASKALHDYALMGPTRSLQGLLDQWGQSDAKSVPTKRLNTLKTWSSNFEWQNRVARFEYLEAERTVEKWQKRQDEIRESDWQLAQDFRRSLRAFLQALPQFITSAEHMVTEPGPDGQDRDVLVRVVGLNTNISQLAQAFKVVSELQRLAAELPTDITQQLSGVALDQQLQVALADYLMAQIESGEDSEIVKEFKRYAALADLTDTG